MHLAETMRLALADVYGIDAGRQLVILAFPYAPLEHLVLTRGRTFQLFALEIG